MVPAVGTGQRQPPATSRRLSTRFLRSELRLIYGRRRNIAGMAVLAVVPIIIAFAVRYIGSPRGGGGGGGEGGFIGQATNNGLFVGLAALTVELPLFLPLLRPHAWRAQFSIATVLQSPKCMSWPAKRLALSSA